MPITYEPTALERHAAEAISEADDYLDRAASLLDVAENALLEEERKNAPFVGIANQYRLIALADLKAEAATLRERLKTRLPA